MDVSSIHRAVQESRLNADAEAMISADDGESMESEVAEADEEEDPDAKSDSTMGEALNFDD